MKKNIHLILLALLLAGAVQPLRAQTDGNTWLFRVYEDNDALNIDGNLTDNSYTNGTRFDLFYIKKRPSRFFIDRLLPKAGDSSLNVYGFGLMQIMVTPNDISLPYDQTDDYPYSGALFFTHTLYSYNSKKNYSFMTELVAGIRGPASLAEPFQKLIHRLINAQEPMGWRNQLGTSPLININITAEKKLFGLGRFAELIGGAQLSAGSMLDAFTFYPLLRIGKMEPYFNGYFSQYSSSRAPGTHKRKSQFYVFAKPETKLVLLNALVHGDKPDAEEPYPPADQSTQRRIRHRMEAINFGAVFARGHFSIAYTQTHSTEYNKGLYHHNVGNVSVYFSW